MERSHTIVNKSSIERRNPDAFWKRSRSMEFQAQHDIINAPSDRWRQTLVAAWREHRLASISLQSRRGALISLDEEALREDDQT
ncbi:hypothetical protein [Asaia prunellae]|uniref:hypothetical protein n=1 Tax=Asaia prunellae TaxID=610245 RepID=UPI00131F1444|nr:hypothetical protein [Asaia prunellae]